MLRIKREGKSRLQWDKVQDSAKKAAFGTGSIRDTQDNKGRYDLIPSAVILRLAQHYENGARKYAERNWEKGQPLHQYYNSAVRHLDHIKDGDLSEDHFAATIWNVAAMIHHIDAMIDGTLPIELDSFGIVAKVKEEETLAQLKEYFDDPPTPKPMFTGTGTRRIPTLISGAIPDGGILDGIIKDNSAREVKAFDIDRFKHKRVEGMTDTEWEDYKHQQNTKGWEQTDE